MAAVPSNIKAPTRANAAPAGPKPNVVRRRADRHELEELESSFWETLFGKRAADGGSAQTPAQPRSRSRATSRAGMRGSSRGELRPLSRMTAARLPEDWDSESALKIDAVGEIMLEPPMALDELRALAAATARAAAQPSPALAQGASRPGYTQSAWPIEGATPVRPQPAPPAAAPRSAAAARRVAPTARPLVKPVVKTEEEEAREELGEVVAPAPSYELAPLFGSDTRSGAASGYGATSAAADLGSADAWWNSSVYVNPGSEPSPSEDLQRVAANIVLVVTQLVSPNLSMAKLSTMHLGDGAKTLLSPAPYAATVWNAIYAGCVCYALFQSPLVAREAPLLRRLGWYTAGAFAATSAWAALVSLADRGKYLPTSLADVTAGAEPLAWAIAFCTAITWALLSLVLRGLAQHVHPFTLGEHLFVVMPLSLYAGWVTILTAVNYGGAMLSSGAVIVSILSPHRAVAGLLVLAAGGVCSAEVVAARGNPWYALGAVWGLLGISASNWRFHKGRNVLSIAGIVGSCVVLIAAFIRVSLLRRRKWRVPWGAARLLVMMAKPGSATKTPPVKAGASSKTTPKSGGSIPLVKPGAAVAAKPAAAAKAPVPPVAKAPVAPANTPASSPAAKPAAAAAPAAKAPSVAPAAPAAMYPDSSRDAGAVLAPRTRLA